MSVKNSIVAALHCGVLLAQMLAGPGRPVASAETISDADRAYLLSHLGMTREFVQDASRGLTAKQLSFKPAPNRWSIAQCIDHLARTEEYVLAMVRERLLKAAHPIEPFPSLNPGRAPIPETPVLMSEVADGLLIRAMTDRTAAIAVPVQERPPVEEVAPAASFDDPRAALDHFMKVRGASIEYVRTTRDDLRSHFSYTRLEGYYPRFKFHDGYQWLLRMSAHTERHLIQIQELKH